MIKPGTLCLLTGTMRDELDGASCTTTSSVRFIEAILGKRAYDVELARPHEGSVYWIVAEHCLRPLNDPDSIVDERNREGITA